MDPQTQTIFDPLRKKAVALTPEERVRQWFIALLRDEMGVPEHLMMSEVSMKLGDKPLRADIVVFGRGDARPLAVVECKRPDVELTEDVLMQVAGYNFKLDVKYVFITNGRRTLGFLKGEDGALVPLREFPKYAEMQAGKNAPSPTK